MSLEKIGHNTKSKQITAQQELNINKVQHTHNKPKYIT